MLRRWRRDRQLKKIKPGDGRDLPPYRVWHALWRSQFVLDLDAPTANGTAGTADTTGTAGTADTAGTVGTGARATEQYAVDVDFFDWDNKAALYRDGRQAATATMPAAFPVPGGVIEVAASMFGLKRIHLVADDGTSRQLRPHPRSAEAWRARLAHRHPGISRAIAGTAVVVLLAALVLGLPQVVEQVSQIPPVAERLGTFESPIALPAWVNTTLVVGGILAAVERALTLRNHWLIDADTWWMGD